MNNSMGKWDIERLVTWEVVDKVDAHFLIITRLKSYVQALLMPYVSTTTALYQGNE